MCSYRSYSFILPKIKWMNLWFFAVTTLHVKEKTKFVRSFFGRNWPICFSLWFYLTFNRDLCREDFHSSFRDNFLLRGDFIQKLGCGLELCKWNVWLGRPPKGWKKRDFPTVLKVTRPVLIPSIWPHMPSWNWVGVGLSSVGENTDTYFILSSHVRGTGQCSVLVRLTTYVLLTNTKK